MSAIIRDYQDLIIWQRGMDFVEEVYIQSEKFPQNERFGLQQQVRRSGVSVPSNIAEGHARQRNEFSNFLSIARGSVAEAETQMLIAARVRYLKPEDIARVQMLGGEIKRMAASLTDKIEAHRSNP